MRTLFVTGGAGFIGGNYVLRSLSQNDDLRIVNLDALTYAACLDNVAMVADHPGYHFVQADIRDRAAMGAVLRDHAPDAVMHLAAESHVDRSIDGPGDFIETNITGTYHLLEAARAYWTGQGKPETFRFHHISTDEVFGSLGDKGQFTETTAYDPRSPYSASKAASDHLVRAWHETYGLPVVLTNCSNNYGPYHFPEKLVPVVILNALAGKPIPVYGAGENVRDWLYVEDHADALLLYCRAFKGLDPESATMTGVDRWGLDVRCKQPDTELRFDFEQAATTETIRSIVVAMVAEARKRLA